jgi:allantoate deiminase
VGKVSTEPGAINIIPGEVTATLDLRHANDEARKSAVDVLLDNAINIASRRGVKVSSKMLSQQDTVPMNPQVTHLLQAACVRAGFSGPTMTSGAGHDAMVIAPHIPSTMLFLRTPGGLSHHPDESVLPQDVEAALATAMEFLTLLRDAPSLHNRSTLKDAHA